jgi:hypothetical protein
LEWKNGDPAGDYFVAFCSTTLNSVDLERTTVPLLDSNDPNSIFDLEGVKDTRLALRFSAILGHHIWRESRITDGPVISDELAEALQAQKLTGFRLDKISAV